MGTQITLPHSHLIPHHLYTKMDIRERERVIRETESVHECRQCRLIKHSAKNVAHDITAPLTRHWENALSSLTSLQEQSPTMAQSLSETCLHANAHLTLEQQGSRGAAAVAEHKWSKLSRASCGRPYSVLPLHSHGRESQRSDERKGTGVYFRN